MTKIGAGKEHFTFSELDDEMIADAWYMVTEYHLNLGPRDNLEQIVKYIHETKKFSAATKRERILEYLRNCTDKEVLRIKRVLIANVPYRLQAPFMPEFKGKAWDVSEKRLVEGINEQKRLMYYFVTFHGLQTEIRMEVDWLLYLQKNLEIIVGWIQFNLIQYLQRRNPSVPGTSDKLYPPQERNLAKVIKYWKKILELCPVYEIYDHQELDGKALSIDHFVPWSYVAHDEFWNLHPTTKQINSSKSNRLPDWERYFSPFAGQEYLSYQMIWRYEQIHDEFEKCAREHLNNWEIQSRLYRAGLTEQEFSGQLKDVLLPVYESARNCGFGNWVYANE